jgi:DeoR/GlpR family transcriptional regulator of sugar metabolism
MRGASTLLPDERRRLIAQRLREHGSVAVTELESQFQISAMTARRDLLALERQGVARRTHGGAVLPGLSSHEDSFYQRLESAVEAKERLARAALDQLAVGESLFVDSSTTGFYTARLIVRENFRCTLMTNAVPIMELVCEAEASQVEVIGVGGMMRKLTRSFVGPQAVRAIESHTADRVIFSVRGISEDGQLTDPDPLEAEIKRCMIRGARQGMLLVDGSKFDRPALSVIANVREIATVLAADVPRAALAPLKRAGADVRTV